MHRDHLPPQALVEYVTEYFAMGLVMTMMENAATPTNSLVFKALDLVKLMYGSS